MRSDSTLTSNRTPSDADRVDNDMDVISAYDDAMAAVPRPSGEEFSTAGPLNERDCDILAFERQWWKFPGAKEQCIRDRFGLSATRYYQVLNGLIDRPEAIAQDPLLVKRLRRLRSERQRARSARRLGFDPEPS
jgi:hypothetical protein